MPQHGVRSGPRQDRPPYNENFNHRPPEQHHLQGPPPHRQWQNIPPTAVPVTSYTHSSQPQILFAAHPASMPIPVPMTGAHQHGTTMMIPQQAYPQQIPQAHMQPPLTYSPQALTMQAPGYAANVGTTQMTMDSSAQVGYGMVHVIGPEDFIGVPPQ